MRAPNHPTLYAAISPIEDWAESFANYVHVVVEGRPFRVEVQPGEGPPDVLESCWDDARCAGKRAWLEQFLAAPTRP